MLCSSPPSAPGQRPIADDRQIGDQLKHAGVIAKKCMSRVYHCASAPGGTGRKRKVTIKVLADLADGSQMRFTCDHYLSKYKSLAVQGYEGNALVHALLTDDWGAPPLRVRILEDGLQVPVIPYR
jgi:hypothetical protein